MFEIKNAMAVVVFLFLKHDDLFLHRGINTVHKFSCTHVVFMQVTYAVKTLHAIFEGLCLWF